MAEKIPDDIKEDLDRACSLHERAVSDYNKCLEFSKLMSGLLAKLEDVGCYRAADKVMSILLNCNPKEGAHCEHATLTAERVKKLKK